MTLFEHTVNYFILCKMTTLENFMFKNFWQKLLSPNTLYIQLIPYLYNFVG